MNESDRDDRVKNPYAPPSSTEAELGFVVSRPDHRWVKRLCWLQLLVIAVALAFEAVEHESIVGSGPIFCLVGIALAMFAFRASDTLAMILGMSAFAFSLLIVFLINYNEWSPAEGDRPITILAMLYTALCGPALVFAALAHDSKHNSASSE